MNSKHRTVESLLFIIKTLTEQKTKMKDKSSISNIDDIIAKTKRKLRKIYKGYSSPFAYEKAEGEYLTTKMILPFTMTKDEQKAYIKENTKRCTSAFDCSGESFTVWMRLFSVNGKTIVYEQTALNV